LTPIDTLSHILNLLIPGMTAIPSNQASTRFLGRCLGSTPAAPTFIYLAAAVLLAGCSGAHAANVAGNKNPDIVIVVATVPVLADMARNVGGSLVEVHSVVPPGADAHSYQTTPRDSVTISRASMTISNGAGFDDSLIPILQSARPSGATHVVASDGVDNESQNNQIFGGLEADPHFWQDPMLAIHYVQQIRDGLVQVDPGNAARYRSQALDYIAHLQKLDHEIAGLLDQVPSSRRILVTHHQAFSHLGGRYGWETMALAPGDAGSVTPEAILLVSEIVKNAGLPSVFVEPRFRSSALEQVGRDAGSRVSPIYAGLGTEANTYVEMMRFNAHSLADNLR
jgi:ABC-type Zn uptake system ZnuABC Zn-binding protein ZnuA